MIYLPATINVLTKGHIRLIEKLCMKDFVIVGLLTSKALKGYKKERVPYKDRKYILDRLDIYGYMVVKQDSLDPSENIIKYGCTAIASGDGWEKSELQAIKDLKIKKINIKSGCKLHSSDI